MFERLRRLLEPWDTGRRGEALAAGWLVRNRGFRILARNWRSLADRRDEIDIVAQDGGILVFVEVKARSSEAMVSGYHAVDRRKRTALRRSIRTYLARLPRKPDAVRLDVVEIGFQPGGAAEVHHYENVRLFPKRWTP